MHLPAKFISIFGHQIKVQFLGHMFGVATPGGYTMTYNILNVLVTPSYDQSALLEQREKKLLEV